MRGLLKFRLGQQDSIAIAMFVLLVFSFVFGGASRQHELRLALVELCAIPALILALTAFSQGVDTRHRFALSLLACIVALPLVQLIPLPPAIWTSLPGRDELTLALGVVDLPQTWLPLTFTPDKTWRSFLALLPPAAMFLAVIAAPQATRLRLVHVILAGIVVAILLGAAQFASGGDRLYLWATTAPGNVTGFFANRNHLATLCLMGMPFAMVLGAGALRRGATSARLSLWLAVLYIALTAVALGVIRSRAGIVLFGPILAGSLLAAWVSAGRGQPKPLLLGLAGGSALAVAAVAAFALGPLLARFDTTGAREGRFENWPIVLEATESHLPVGTGIGSFDAVYRSVEPLDRLDSSYFNQAHNDYLETLLETGWFGGALILIFLIWFTRRAWTAWSASISTQRDLQRAATVAIAVVLLHSGVDYPLRTATLATIFALCCGLLELAVRSDSALSPERTPGRRRSRSR